MLSKLPFYKEMNVIKSNHAFRGYAVRYKAEQIAKKKKIQLNSYKQVNQVLKTCLVIFQMKQKVLSTK